MRAADIVLAAGGELASGEAAAEFARVVVDSREAAPGDLFWSLPGERTDGALFWPEALARGAAGAVLPERPADWPAEKPLLLLKDRLQGLRAAAARFRRLFHPRVVAVTGSVGKTGTKDILAAVLGQRWRVLASSGNQNTEIGLPLNLLRLDRSVEIMVVEMGMRGLGEIAALAELAKPEIGIVTNIGPSHLERLGSLERIAEAKGELLRALPSGGLAVLNGDDSRVRRLGEGLSVRRVYAGFEEANDVRALDLSLGPEGSRFALSTPGAQASVEIRLPGRPAVRAALFAAAVALHLGLALEEIASYLSALSPDVGRVRFIEIGDWTVIDDSYNASPASMAAALELLELRGRGRRKIAVLGDMMELGVLGPPAHREVGRMAAGIADVLLAVGEAAGLMVDGARLAGMAEERALIAADREEALVRLDRLLRPGDIILLKASRAVGLDRLLPGIRRLAGEPDS